MTKKNEAETKKKYAYTANLRKTNNELKSRGCYITPTQTKEEFAYFEMPLSKSISIRSLEQVKLCKQVE